MARRSKRKREEKRSSSDAAISAEWTVRIVRQGLVSAALPAEEESLPIATALGGLAHLVHLLERLAGEVRRGRELDARLFARAHVETWLVVEYLVRERDSAYKVVVGDYLRSLRILQERLGPEADPQGGIDLTEALSWFAEIEPAQLKVEELARAIATHAESPGFNRTIYDLVYRSLSGLGVHPNLWLFEQYVEHSDGMLRPKLAPVPSPLASARAAIVLTLIAADDVFEAAGVERTAIADALEQVREDSTN